MKNKIQKLFNLLGYKITKTNKFRGASFYSKESLLENFYLTLKEAGYKPKFVIDIGANTGAWTKEILNYFPDVSVLMIDPQESLKYKFQDILNDKITYLPVGVGDKNDVLKFTLHRRDDSSSFIYSEEDAKEQGLEQIEVPIKTLNSIIKENSLSYPDLVKIDAEGLDLEVIDGATDLYGKTEIFMVEAAVGCKNYKNTVLKMINKMDDAGYQLFDITDLNRPFQKTPLLWLVELVFVKKDSVLHHHNLQI